MAGKGGQLPSAALGSTHNDSAKRLIHMSSLQQQSEKQLFSTASHHARNTSAMSLFEDSVSFGTDDNATPHAFTYGNVVRHKDQDEQVESIQEFLDWSCKNPTAAERQPRMERFNLKPLDPYVSNSSDRLSQPIKVRRTNLMPQRTLSTPADLGRYLSRANTAPLPSRASHTKKKGSAAAGQLPGLLGPLTKFKRKFPATIGPLIRVRTMPVINAIRSRRSSSVFSKKSKRARKERRKSQLSITPEESSSVSPTTPPSPSNELSLSTMLAATDFVNSEVSIPSYGSARMSEESDPFAPQRENVQRTSRALGLLDYLDETRRGSVAPRSVSLSTRNQSARSSVSRSIVKAFPPALGNLEPAPQFHISFNDNYFAAPSSSTTTKFRPVFTDLPLESPSGPRSAASRITIVPLDTERLAARDASLTPVPTKRLSPNIGYFAPEHPVHVAPYNIAFAPLNLIKVPKIALTRPSLLRPRSQSDTPPSLLARRRAQTQKADDKHDNGSDAKEKGQVKVGKELTFTAKVSPKSGDEGAENAASHVVRSLRKSKMTRRRALSY